MNNFSIVLAADYKSIDKVGTVIKSICKYNQNIDFYILNDDYPQEWFKYMDFNLKSFNSKIFDIKIKEKFDFHIAENHITKEAFFRYYIPNYIGSDIVLYLDIDIIVKGNLTHLSSFNFEDNYCAAVYDIGLGDYFNSGVMLINNLKWREDNISEKLIKYTNEYGKNLDLVDQSVLNIIFKDKWIKLDSEYNYQVGALFIFQHHNKQEDFNNYYKLSKNNPLIIHYTTSHKPWISNSSGIFRELWWEDYTSEWSDILKFNNKINQKKKLFILTNTANIEKLEYIIKSMPEYEIVVGAYTLFADNILGMQKYLNFKVYQQILNPVVDELLDECVAYLDINHYNEVNNIVSKCNGMNKPVFAFDVTNHDTTGKSKVFKVDEVDKMIEEIKKL
ncbi:glycosyltransferase family 8 protein [Gemelliphila palaticanis]|uniref:Glycosyltransferase family 8 protein n=1 Tax=Gemelliphila palaticanis TaxID=81950 RepID=A0ABX2T2X3_9BACL|nr:glycosyltransferase family 8 protein [Gemella palaticanis]MBF0716052.1 glycosyltransferase family 8 protein [Gemella palaticanis]NYS47982.1 glycosyltransferase family 8 protein [Gemella palaticanis]